jgi:hypothetical protein
VDWSIKPIGQKKFAVKTFLSGADELIGDDHSVPNKIRDRELFA